MAVSGARDSWRSPSTAAAAVCLLLVLPMMATAANNVNVAHCPSCHGLDEAVFPYWSMCVNPARYAYDGGRYYLSSADMQHLVAPEWDDRTSTYYVRLSNIGATYGFTHNTLDYRHKVLLNDTFVITNLETGRHLGWREEGGERFLVETNHGDLIQYFRFSTTTELNGIQQLPCPLISGARCAAYNILTAGTSTTNDGLGVGAYVENGVTYFKEQCDSHFPFLLNVATFVNLQPGLPVVPCILH